MYVPQDRRGIEDGLRKVSPSLLFFGAPQQIAFT